MGADFTVSLRVGVDLSLAVESDMVEDTLNYATLYEVVKKEMDFLTAAGTCGRAHRTGGIQPLSTGGERGCSTDQAEPADGGRLRGSQR